MIRFLLALLATAPLFGQPTVSITSPSPGAIWSNWTGNQFAVSLANAPSVVQVCYAVDAYPAVNPGPPTVIAGDSGALAAAGCSNRAPFSFPANSYWWANGTQHLAIATAYDSLGNVIAVSSPVTFTIANTWPVSCGGSAPVFTVTSSTPFTVSWKGQVNVTAKVTGACTSNNLSASFFIDGIYQGPSKAALSDGTITSPLDTTGFPNGSHVVAVTLNDNTNGTSYGGYNVTAAGEFSRAVTFANGSVPAYIKTNARRMYIAPRETFTLTPSLINTDGSVASGALFHFVSANPSVATVSYTGTASASTTVQGVSQGAAQIYSMAEQKRGTDGKVSSNNAIVFHSNTLGNHPNYLHGLIKIVSGANCIPGFYLIGSANPLNGDLVLQDPAHPGVNVDFATSKSAVCTWIIGLTRVSWAQVNPVNAAIAHFSNRGSILTSYTPGSSIVLNALFQSMQEISSQPYPVPYLNNICQSGYNTLETGGLPFDAAGWKYPSQSALASSIAGYLSSQTSLLTSAPCRLYLWLTGDSMMRNGDNLYVLTQGPASARNGSTWGTSGIATLFQAYANSNAVPGNPQIIGMTMVDEFGYPPVPMQGPITLGGPTNNQNWLGSSNSITASGGTCTVTASTSFPGGGWSMLQANNPVGGFVISGSITPGMNTPIGSRYVAKGSQGTGSFTFPCPRVADGIYNSTNDPTLRINVLACCGWYTPPSGGAATDFLRDDALAYLASQIDSVRGRIPAAPSISGGGTKVEASCVNGGANSYCGQFLTENGVKQYTVGGSVTFDDQYWTQSYLETYLSARQGLNSAIADSPPAYVQQGYRLQDFYGSYDPAKPLVSIDSGTSINFGLNVTPPSRLAVASCVGNTITFSSPHHITNIIPGASRLWITGSSDPKCNANFVILSWPTPSTIRVAYAATRNTCADTGAGSCAYNNGGTVTFENGDQFTLYEISADGRTSAMGFGGPTMDYGSSAISKGAACGGIGNDSFIRHRGQTFTLNGVGGPGASYFNGTTFVYDVENLSQPTDGNGTTTACNNFFREIPVLDGTGGTASVVYDGSYVQGRNPGAVQASGNADPAWTFVNIVVAMILRAAGTRLYATMQNPVAFVSQAMLPSKGGWTGAGSGGTVARYGETGLGLQLFAHPNVESGYSVPDFWAGSAANHMWSRLAKYYLGATALNSIDYGPIMESGTFRGAYGYLHIILNASNGPQTRTVSLVPFETAGQNVILWMADAIHGIQPLTIIKAGTSTYQLTLQPGQAAYLVFPKLFAGELEQPSVALRLADVPNATSVTAQCSYDRYLLPNAMPMNLGSGNGGVVTAPLMMDKNVAPIYCTFSYLGSQHQLLAGGPNSPVVTF